MKKFFLAIAVAILSFEMGSYAHAQSSVTLYGVLDAGVDYTNNVHGSSQTQANGGGLYGERWGVRGIEDLGGGTRAIFTLENGFTSSTGMLGQGGLEFGRQAFVGLASDRYGTVTMGRQYDAIADTLGVYGSGLMYNGYYTVHMGDFDHLGGERTNNAVKYVTPCFFGVTFEAMYGLGGQPGSIAQGSTMGFGVKYANGGFTLGAATVSVRNAAADLNASFGITNLEGTPLATGKNVLQTSSLGIFGVGSSYVLGRAIISAVYTQTYVNNAYVTGKQFGTLLARIAEAGVNYFVTPALNVGVDYMYSKLDDFRWQEPGVAVHYFLSKRTDVYAVAAYQHAMGTAQYANIFTVGSSSTANQTVARVGLRHNF